MVRLARRSVSTLAGRTDIAHRETPMGAGAGQVVSPVPLRLPLADADFVGVHVPDNHSFDVGQDVPERLSEEL